MIPDRFLSLTQGLNSAAALWLHILFIFTLHNHNPVLLWNVKLTVPDDK